MFGRIRRFFIALRVLRQKAREDRQIRKELNLNSMGYLVDTLVSKPKGEAKINTISVLTIAACLSNGFKPQTITEEDVQKVLEESRVDPAPVSRTKAETEAILDEHTRKFIG